MTQESAMMDSCQVLTFAAGSQNSKGEYPTPTYTAGTEIVCGFRPSGREVEDSNQTYKVTEAKIRLPASTVIVEKDRITITKRFGTAITPATFEVFGPTISGPSGMVVKVKKVDL